MSRLLLFFFTCAVLYAQLPLIYYRGVVNVASYMPPALPAGGIAQGAQFSIFGSNLGPPTTPALTFPLATTLSGVSISITQGTATVAAIPVFLSPGQINAIMPSNAPVGMASLRLTYNNSRSNYVPVRVVASSFGIFTSTGTGQGPGSIENYSTTALPLNSLNSAAQPGQVEILYGVGLGAGLGPDNVAPTSGNLPTQTEVFVGGIPATVSYSGRSACCAGIDQINFQVPSSAPTGCWVPVAVRTQGSIMSNYVTMAIGQNQNCSEPNNPLAAALIGGGQQASFLAARFSTSHAINVATPLGSIADYVYGLLYQQKASPYNFNPYLSLPPAGTCTAYSVSSYTPSGLPNLANTGPTGRGLDAGQISISTAGLAPATLPAGTIAGTFSANIGGNIPLISVLPNTQFLNPGAFTIAGSGGGDISSFSAPFTMPVPLTWTNQSSLTSVDRTQPLTVTWSGVAPGYTVLVAGIGMDLADNATTAFVCQTRPGDLSFTVPVQILGSVPPQRLRPSQSLGVIYIGEVPLSNPVALTASGLNSGQVMPAQFLGQSIFFK
jgi:uncharacterized protein (TIGR03437 family)